MKWSKRKKCLEDLLADSLQGRVKYHITRYGPGESDFLNRAWVTFDQIEILSCSNIQWMNTVHQMTGSYTSQDEKVLQELLESGIFTRWHFMDAVEEYLNLSIERALGSTDILVRAFAMFDRRLGIRRLQALRKIEAEHPVVLAFYQVRCGSEGIRC